jgi:hypothetical protein
LLKQCAKCKELKEESEFHKNNRNKDGLHSYCKKCNYEASKEYNGTEKGKQNVKRAYQKQYSTGYFKYGKGAILNMSKSAQERNIEFKLSEDELYNWWVNSPDICSYCGISIEEYIKLRDFVINYEGAIWEINRYKRFFKLENQAKINDMTIDRVNNDGAYEINNIKKACWFCNSLKSDFHDEEEIKVIGKIVVDKLRKLRSELHGDKKQYRCY